MVSGYDAYSYSWDNITTVMMHTIMVGLQLIVVAASNPKRTIFGVAMFALSPWSP